MPPRPTLLLPLNGSLAGQAGGAPVTATGAGALRYRASDLAGRSCALVEVGGENLLANPSAETNTTGWGTSAVGTVLTWVTTDAYVGAASLRFVGDGVNVPTISTAVSGTAVNGDAFALQARIKGAVGAIARIRLRILDGAAATVRLVDSASLTCDGTWQSVTLSHVIADAAAATVQFYALGLDLSQPYFVDTTQAEKKPYASSYIDGSLGAGYSWTGTPHNSTSIRALTTLESAYPGAIQHLYCRYSEDWGATWSTAHLTAAGPLGTYGVVQLSLGVLHLESSRALMVRDLAVYDVALSAEEQAAVSAAVTNGTIGQATGYAPGLLLPV